MGNLWLVMDRETWGTSGTRNHQSVWILFNHTLDQMRCVWSSMEDHFETKAIICIQFSLPPLNRLWFQGFI